MTASLPLMKDAIGQGRRRPGRAAGLGPAARGCGTRTGSWTFLGRWTRVPARLAAGQTDFTVPFYEPDVSKAEARLREIVEAFRGW